MCIIFLPPDGGWSTACDGGRELMVKYPSAMPGSDDWLPDDEGEQRNEPLDGRKLLA